MVNKHKKSQFLTGFITLIILSFSLVAGLVLLRKPQKPKVSAFPSSTLYISPSSQTLNPGQNFEFHLTADTGENRLTGVDIVVNYDPDVLEVKSLAKGTNISTFENVIIEEFDNDKGQLQYTLFTIDLNKAVSGSSINLLNITATVRDSAQTGSGLLTIDSSSAASAAGETENVITETTNAQIEIVASLPQPTQGEPNSCGGTCGSNYNCQSGLFCYQGYCRNPQCPNLSDCNCISPISTSTPKPSSATLPTNTSLPKPKTKTPSATPQTTVSPKPTITALFSPTPIPYFAEEIDVQDQDLNKPWYFTAIILGISGIFVLVLLIWLVKYLKNRNKPIMVNP